MTDYNSRTIKNVTDTRLLIPNDERELNCVLKGKMLFHFNWFTSLGSHPSQHPPCSIQCSLKLAVQRINSDRITN
jgi:hypothetical protein